MMMSLEIINGLSNVMLSTCCQENCHVNVAYKPNITPHNRLKLPGWNLFRPGHSRRKTNMPWFHACATHISIVPTRWSNPTMLWVQIPVKVLFSNWKIPTISAQQGLVSSQEFESLMLSSLLLMESPSVDTSFPAVTIYLWCQVLFMGEFFHYMHTTVNIHILF